MIWVLFIGYVLPEKIEKQYRKVFDYLLEVNREVWETCLSSWGGRVPVRVEGRIVNYKKVYYTGEPIYLEIKIYPVVDEPVIVPPASFFFTNLGVYGSVKKIGEEKEGFLTVHSRGHADFVMIDARWLKTLKPLAPGDTLCDFYDCNCFRSTLNRFQPGFEYHLCYLWSCNMCYPNMQDVPSEYRVKPYFWGLIIDTMDISFEIHEPPPEEKEVSEAVERIWKIKHKKEFEKAWEEGMGILRKHPNSVYIPVLFEKVFYGIISKAMDKGIMKDKRKEMYEVLDWFVEEYLSKGKYPRKMVERYKELREKLEKWVPQKQ